MTEEDTAAIEYSAIRALRNFDSVVGAENQSLIRLALRQGRSLMRAGEVKGGIESLSKFANTLIESVTKVTVAWEDVKKSVAKLEETYASYSVKQLDSISSARSKYENLLGRASGLSDVLEGMLQESDDQKTAQEIIESLAVVRDAEKNIRQGGPSS